MTLTEARPWTRLLEKDKPDTPSPPSLLRYCVTSRLFNSVTAQWHRPSAKAALAASSSLAGVHQGLIWHNNRLRSLIYPTQYLVNGVWHPTTVPVRRRREAWTPLSAQKQLGRVLPWPEQHRPPSHRSTRLLLRGQPEATTRLTPFPRGTAEAGEEPRVEEPSEHPDRGRLPGAAEQRLGPSAAGAGTSGSTPGQGDRDGGRGRRGVGSRVDGHRLRPSAGHERRRQGGGCAPPVPHPVTSSAAWNSSIFPPEALTPPPTPAPPPRRCAPRRPPPALRLRASARAAGLGPAPAKMAPLPQRQRPGVRREMALGGRVWCCHTSQSLWLREAGGPLVTAGLFLPIAWHSC